jgi:uncharacterized protein
MIIDCHIHLLPRQVREDRISFCRNDSAFGIVYASKMARMVSEKEIIEYLDRSQIDKAVVFGFPWEDHDLVTENNDAVWSFYQRWPDRVIPFAVLSANGGEKAHRETERTLSAGFAGIGELAVYHRGWSRESLEDLGPSLELARSYGVPVLIHVNEPVGHYYPGKILVDFQGLLGVIEANPHVDFILAHFGGGVFIYALMPEIGRSLARTYLDTSACPFLYDSRIFDIASRVLEPQRILFGSDYPLLPLSRYLKEMDRAGLDNGLKAAILGENAAKLFAKSLQRVAGPN